MSPVKPARTEQVTQAYTTTRLLIAAAFLEQAKISTDLLESIYANNAVVSSATIAGIAASDAACGIALGEVISSPGHNDALVLLKRINGGADMVKSLRTLLNLKTPSQYTTHAHTDMETKSALRHAEKLLDFAKNLARSG